MRLMGGGVLALAVSCALAQEQDAVVVTATRIAQPSLDIPASIDRVQAEDIRFMRPQVNLSESLGRVPGITVQNRNNYAQDLQIQSRGFGARSTFGIRGIRLIADGIPQTMPDGQGQVSSFDLGSAERIEVLRGPFSPMYGNAAGGVINIITEPGSREPGVGIDMMGASYGTWRLGLRGSGVHGNGSGIIDMSRFQTDGYRDHSAVARRDLVNAKIDSRLGADTGLTVVANYLDMPDALDPSGLTRAQMDANPRQVAAPIIQFDTRKTVRQNQGGATLTQKFGASNLAVSGYVGERNVRQYLSVPGGGATPNTTSGGVVDLVTPFWGGSVRFSNESKVGGLPLITTVGAEYERMDQARKGYVNNNGNLGALRRNEEDVVSSTGLYAQADWRFTEKWSVLAGLRSTRVAFTSTDFYIVPGTPNNPDDSGAVTYDDTTPSIGLLYRVAPTTSVYASYGRGFETPTFAELAHQNTGSGLNFGLQASKSRHLEAGVKSIINPRLRVNAAVFSIETDNEIVVDQSTGGRTTFKNAGRTRRNGAELYADTMLPGGFEGTLAWTLLEAIFLDSYQTGTPPQTVPAGNRLPAVPNNYFYGELKWRHAPTGFATTLEVLYKSDVAVNDLNTEFADAYTIASFAFGFTQGRSKWRVTEYMRIDNLFNKQYAGSVIVNDTNGRYYEPSPQRNMTVGVQAKLQF
jgi:iron complex outermembrane receptor protein